MGNKIVTEADRKRTPAPKPLPGTTPTTHGRGQKISLERGVATRSKKNPGRDLKGRLINPSALVLSSKANKG
jgi:hypothetical protein